MGYLLLILLILFGPPLFLFSLGRNSIVKKSAKNYYIAAVIYLIVGFGICGSIISNI